jgi:hypothetical protein
VLDHLLLHAGLDPETVELGFLEEPEATDGIYFGPDQERPDTHVIAIGPAALKDPAWLSAMLSHEISHYWLHGILEIGPPYPWDEEALTDLSAIYLGFGPLTLGSAAPYQHMRESMRNYLSEEEKGLAFALYLALHGIEEAGVSKYLRPAIAAALRRNVRFLELNPEIVESIRDRPGEMLRGVEWRTFDEPPAA